MSDVLNQDQRFFHFRCPGFDEADLIVRSLRGREAISELYSFHLQLASEAFNLDVKEMIGKTVELGVRLADEKSFRYFGGLISRARAIAAPLGNKLALYEVEVVPEIWKLTKTSDCRVYQEISIPDVVADVLQRFDFGNKRIQTSSPHAAWNYLTQYRESSFDFISRLMETEGIFYFFEFEKSKTTLVVADDKASHKECAFQKEYRLAKMSGRGYNRPEDIILTWDFERRFRSGKYTHKDFNYEDPTTDLLHEEPAKEKLGASDKFEVYDYPGEYEDRTDAKAWAELRMKEEEVEQRTVQGQSNARCLTPGFKFELKGHDDRSMNGWYVVTSVEHDAREGSLLTSMAPEEHSYSNSFTCIPLDVPFVPGRKTLKHVMRGLQTATVTGPSGEEIYCDDMGRIKVQFHWDRLGKKDEKTSCWIRVMQPWAGSDYGTHFLPRIGDEVVVDFLEGDPDRPLVVGSVRNPVRDHHWKMPSRKNWTGIKSKSTKGGGADDANEIRLDDTKGEELFLIRAQKDMEVTVENNLNEEVGVDVHRTVGSKTYLVVGSDTHCDVGGNSSTNIASNSDLTVGVNLTETIGANMELAVGANLEQNVGANMTLSVGANLSISAGARVVISGGAGVTLIGPSGHVDLGPSGIVLQGPMLYLNCGMPHSGPATPAKKAQAQKPTKATKPEKYKDK